MRTPQFEIRDLSPVLDGLRNIKSKREIDVIRRATEIAGLAIIEAMRSTEPGVYEYQLDAAAKYVFYMHGSRGDGYASIIGGGTNAYLGHYFRKTDKLKDGDLVLMDYAPDYRYYTSDVTRMWPVNGKYTKGQRALTEYILAYRGALFKYIRPGVTSDFVPYLFRVSLEHMHDQSLPMLPAAVICLVSSCCRCARTFQSRPAICGRTTAWRWMLRWRPPTCSKTCITMWRGCRVRSPSPATNLRRGFAGFVYRVIRGATRKIGDGMDHALQLLNTKGSTGQVYRQCEILVAALNGLVGDHLHESGNPLSIPMWFRRDGVPLQLESESLRHSIPRITGKLAVFVHGLCMRHRRCRAQPPVRRGLWQGQGLLRVLSLDVGL